MKKTIFLFSLVLFGLFSCEKEKIDPGMAPNSTLAGHWTVNEYSLDMVQTYGPAKLLTYNTSFDQNSIWIDNIYDSNIKMKANVLSATSFGMTGGIDANGNPDIAKISISEASIVADSIIFRVTMYDAIGDIIDDYYEAGHRTTGWDDDHHVEL